MPEVSVLLPVYNGATTLKHAISSVLSQDFLDYELLIIDDGSQDGSVSIAQSFGDHRIQIISNKTNLGLQKTLNRGLSFCQGKYIARIDADDIWSDTEKLKEQVRFLEDNKEYVLVGTAVLIQNNHKKKNPVFPPQEDHAIRDTMLCTNNFFHSSVLFKKEVAIACGGYSEDVDVRHIEDYSLWLEMGLKGKMKNIPKQMLLYSHNPRSISNMNRIEQLKKSIFIIKKYKSHYPKYQYARMRNVLKLIVYGYLDLFWVRNIFLFFKKTENEFKKNKPMVVIWEGLETISGGQRVLLNALPILAKYFRLKIFLPKKGDFSKALDLLDIKYYIVPSGSYTLGKKTILDIAKFIFFLPISILRGCLKIRGADIIYVNSARVLVFAFFVAKLSSIPIIWHGHSSVGDKKSRILLEKIGKSKVVKSIIAVSHALASEMPALSHKTKVIYNGVDMKKFSFTQKKKDDILRIGIIGDIIPMKGHSIVIDALSKAKFPYELCVVGSPRVGYESYENSLKKKVKKNNQENSIFFLSKSSSVHSLIPKFDIVCVPSTVFEACPMVVLESFACGRPVIASDVGGNKELVSDTRYGYLFKVGDDADLLSKIQLFLSLENEQRLSQQKDCREYAENNFSLEKMTEKIMKLIHQNSYETFTNQ